MSILWCGFNYFRVGKVVKNVIAQLPSKMKCGMKIMAGDK